MAKKYPDYGFEKHKGYGTEFHRRMIEEHGASRIHRKSFKTFNPEVVYTKPL